MIFTILTYVFSALLWSIFVCPVLCLLYDIFLLNDNKYVIARDIAKFPVIDGSSKGISNLKDEIDSRALYLVPIINILIFLTFVFAFLLNRKCSRKQFSFVYSNFEHLDDNCRELIYKRIKQRKYISMDIYSLVKQIKKKSNENSQNIESYAIIGMLKESCQK